MMVGLGVSLTGTRGGSSGAMSLLGAETQGLSIDFTDLSMVIKDTGTPANTFSGNPNSKLTYSAPSAKLVRGSNGSLSSGTTLRTAYNSAGSPLGALIEGEARTNMLLQSSNLSATWVPAQVSFAAQSITAPDGSGTAYALLSDATAGQHSADQTITMTVASWTLSAWVKKGAVDVVCFYVNTVGGRWFNLATGAVGSNAGGVNTATIEAFSNGWYRCSMTFTGTGVAAAARFLGCTADGDFNSNAGNGALLFYLWGAQAELGSFVSSHIVTAGATATRAADTITLATSLFPFSASVGSLYAQFMPAVAASEMIAAQIDDGTVNNRFAIGNTSGATAELKVLAASVAQTTPLTDGVVTGTSLQKLATSWAVNNFNLSFAGANAVNDALGVLPTVTTLRLGQDGSGVGNLYLARLLYLPRTQNASEVKTQST
jgi:hypothetical protein